MKHLIRVVVLAAVVALGWWLWTVGFPSPAEQVRQRMTRLAQTATISAQDSPIARAAKAQKFSGMFSRDVTISISPTTYGAREISGIDDLSETAMGAFANVRSLKVNFVDVSVTVAPDRQSAAVSCTAEVRFGNSKDLGVNEMWLRFQKIDGRWLITHAETVKTLS